jgi:eukaryotic-like serine/threonine-protein kinase
MDKIGKYHLLRKLGEGSTGAVHLSFDPFGDRDVAIKIAYPKALQDPESGHLYRRIFETEAALAGKLDHPHIVGIYDAVIDGSLCYIVMEFVEGGTLEKYSAFDNLLPFERLIDIMYKCTRALEFARAGGIIHRDLKPANILLVGAEEQVKISDFGSAIVQGSGVKPLEGIGSPAYMSPEQATHKPLDFRTDVYSMGVVMYQLLTGRLPFTGSNYQSVLHQVVNFQMPPPSDFRLDIPQKIEAIVVKATAKKPEDRFQSWDEFGAALQGALKPDHANDGRVWADSTDSEKFSLLRSFSFFSEFEDVELWETLKLAQWQSYPAGITVMRENEIGEYFCVVLAGEVKISRQGRTITILGPGECVGEMAYLRKADGKRGADVVAAEELQLLTIRTTELEAASESCRHDFDRAFLSLLVERLALANARLTGS